MAPGDGTNEASPIGAERLPDGQLDRWRRLSAGGGTLVAVIVCLAIPAIVYDVRHLATPIGNDALKYIWRARLVGSAGARALGRVPAGPTLLPDRPGLPVLASIVQAITRISPFRF